MTQPDNEKPFDVLLFDLGGIFVKLSGAPRMMALTRETLSIDELWTKWLDSPSVKNFESGKSSSKEFAMAMVDEFGLIIDPLQFLEEFAEWSNTLYPGTRTLLNTLSANYTLASLSNTNFIHWEYFCEDLKLPDLFHYNFPSHETGYIKPDKEAFINVIQTLSCRPERILFIDDIQQNVDSARKTGMAAIRVKGIDQVATSLHKMGVLNDIRFNPSDPSTTMEDLRFYPTR
ncbi:MAG: HAD-IA family hydrolase [Proteobacteria bacterium]|nr:HAD-IA family hydrolase [Pseudomonadota bacterium]